MHILGENAGDATSLLAPLADPSGSANDFVNTHAMFARALAQALCFPVMYPALFQLLSYKVGTPRIQMVDAGDILPIGVELTFADVVRQVTHLLRGDICLGIYASNIVPSTEPLPGRCGCGT